MWLRTIEAVDLSDGPGFVIPSQECDPIWIAKETKGDEFLCGAAIRLDFIIIIFDFLI